MTTTASSARARTTSDRPTPRPTRPSPSASRNKSTASAPIEDTDWIALKVAAPDQTFSVSLVLLAYRGAFFAETPGQTRSAVLRICSDLHGICRRGATCPDAERGQRGTGRVGRNPLRRKRDLQ